MEKSEKYDFDDDVFGLPTIPAMVNDAMVEHKVDPKHGVSLLNQVLELWPAEYANGGRRWELYQLVNDCVKSVTLIILILLVIAPLEGVAGHSVISTSINRVKREGFGPSEVFVEENRDVAKTLKQIRDFIVIEAQTLENVTAEFAHEVVNVLEHPIKTLSRSWLGIAFMVILGIAVVSGIIFLSVPVIRIMLVLFRGFWVFLLFIFRTFGRLGCCMRFCAFGPFVYVRNKYRDFHIWRKMETTRNPSKQSTLSRLIYRNQDEPMEELSFIERYESEIKTDERGAYLSIGDNKRVYFKRLKDASVLKDIGDSMRDNAVPSAPEKETYLAGSKLYKAKAMPAFQGQFAVSGKIVGHFSRIKYQGKSCLMTAYHVLDYNRAAALELVKGDKMVMFSSTPVQVLAASKTNEFDFIIMAVHDSVFSHLGIKQGVIAPRAYSNEAVSIYQIHEGQLCFSLACAKIDDERSWMVNYRASTVVSSSGAPILNNRGEIIGIHIEGDKNRGLNVGVIPPIFRLMNPKESAVANDMTDKEPDFAYISDEEFEKALDEDEIAQLQDKYSVLIGKYMPDEPATNWGEYMDKLDEVRTIVDVIEGDVDDFTPFKKKRGNRHSDKWDVKYITAYKSTEGRTGTHINHEIKHGRFRKESPWTCSKCHVVQESGFKCSVCGYAIVPLSSAKLKASYRAAKEEVEKLPLPVEITDKILGYIASDTFQAKLTLRIQAVLDNVLKGNYGVPLYPELPSSFDKVKIDKKLQTEMRTDHHPPTWLDHDRVTDVGKPAEPVIVRHLNDWDSHQKQQLIKLEPVKPMNRSARRRANRRAKAKAVIKETAVPISEPLNSTPPANTGDYTNGVTPKPSATNQLSSDGVASHSMAPSVKKNQKSGRKPKRSNRTWKATPGRREEPWQNE